MPETPNRGLPYPTYGSPSDVPGYLQQLAEAVDVELGSKTSWTLVTLASDIEGTIRYRLTGNVVEVDVDVDGTFANGITTLASVAIPTAIRPQGGNARGGAYLNGNEIGQVYVTSAGTIGLLHQTGTRATCLGQILWTIEQ